MTKPASLIGASRADQPGAMRKLNLEYRFSGLGSLLIFCFAISHYRGVTSWVC